MDKRNKKSKSIIWIISLLSLLGVSSCDNTPIKHPIINNSYTNYQIDCLIHGFNTEPQQEDISFVPQQVQLALMKDFPDHSDIEWTEGNNVYKAEFDIKFSDFKAYYDTDGTLLMYKVEISLDQLPAIVKNTAIASYPDFNFEDQEKIVVGTRTYYEIEMERGGKDIIFVCNSDGNAVIESIVF